MSARDGDGSGGDGEGAVASCAGVLICVAGKADSPGPCGEAEPVIDRFDVGVMQGYVEESNVNAVQEMSQLIMVSRAFENITALMRDSEGSLDEAIKTLGGGK